MPPLETIAELLVAELGVADLYDGDTVPAFVARWGYDNTYRMEEHTPDDPIDVLFMIKAEESEILNRTELQGTFDIDCAIRVKVSDQEKETVLALRTFTDAVFYWWSKRSNRRLAGIDKVWVKTTVQAAFDPDMLREKFLFFAVATLQFEGVR